jgi:beta-barrel assembly-enhancing protease
LWRLLIQEAAASQFPDVRRRNARSSIFNTHPVSAERAAALDALAKVANDTIAATATSKRTWIVGKEAHRNAIRPFLSVWLRDELRRRDYGQFFDLVTRLKRNGTDLGVLTFFEAEGYRLRRKEGDLDKAFAAYQLASQQADVPPDVWRELADAHLRAGRSADAANALRTYLARAPNASDRALVQARLTRITNPT